MDHQRLFEFIADIVNVFLVEKLKIVIVGSGNDMYEESEVSNVEW